MFLRHTSGRDRQGLDNQKHVMGFKQENKFLDINSLWLVDEERMPGDDGIDQSKHFIVFVTQAYIDKVAGRAPRGEDDRDTSCRL